MRIGPQTSLLTALLLASPVTAGDCAVLLHGLARTSRSMAKMEKAFREKGFRVANIDYPSRKHPIEELSETTVTEGLAACGVEESAKVHFVTHSLGGILVRYYLERHEVPRLGRVVMIAPPNQGSRVVDVWRKVPGFALYNGPAGLQLGTDPNGIPARLGPVTYPVGVIAGTRTFNPILSLSLPDPDDGKVSVERAKVEGMADFIILPVSHPFIMKDDEAIRQTLAFIETGAFLRETP